VDLLRPWPISGSPTPVRLGLGRFDTSGDNTSAPNASTRTHLGVSDPKHMRGRFVAPRCHLPLTSTTWPGFACRGRVQRCGCAAHQIGYMHSLAKIDSRDRRQASLPRQGRHRLHVVVPANDEPQA